MGKVCLVTRPLSLKVFRRSEGHLMVFGLRDVCLSLLKKIVFNLSAVYFLWYLTILVTHCPALV